MENINSAVAQNSLFNFTNTSVVGNVQRMIPSIGSFFTAAGNCASEISSSAMAQRFSARAEVSTLYSELATFGWSALRFLQNSGLSARIQTLIPLILPQTFAILGIASITLAHFFEKSEKKYVFSAVKFLVLFAVKFPFKLTAQILLLVVSWAKKMANFVFLISLLVSVPSLAIGSPLGSNAQLLDQITGNFATYALTSGILMAALYFTSKPLNFAKNM
jgi:hypothetical protein